MNLNELIQKVEKARLEVDEHLIVKIVAVSKYSDSEAVKKLYNEGQRAFGENRVQVLEEKVNNLNELPIEWHFIGNLQKNKINKLLKLNPFMIQSINSLELAKEIDKRAKKPIRCLLEINSAKEESKSGIEPEKAIDIYHQILEECPNINLQGVMTIGAHNEDKKEIIKSFKLTHSIFENLKNRGAKICSMGMSNDFELAIKCGSNMIRVGSALFK
jgi:pyridoxal phosphate enzyme (YggS family)